MSNTIKSDKIALEQLLNSISPATPGERGDGVTGAVDSSGGAPVEPEQIIIFDRAGEQKAARKRARNTVKLMAQHALPQPLLDEEYVQNKMEQDTATLADLDWQVKSNSLVQNALLDVIARGNTAPRNFEVYTQLTDKISALSKQIQVTEATMRKTYLDLKLEIRDKQAEERQNLDGPAGAKQIQGRSNHNVITGGGKLAELLMYKRMKTLEAAQDGPDEQ